MQYAIWVWLTSGTGGSAKIKLAASPSRVRPTFSVCVPTGGSTCSVAGLNAGQHAQVQAELRAPDSLARRDIRLTVTATSHQARNSATASATIEVDPKPRHTSATPTPTPSYSYGPYGGFTGPGGTYPGGTNPAGNLGSAFPQVSPSPNISPTSRHQQDQARVTDASAAFPLDVRLIGGQVIGLAILATAVTIAVARLSLRRQPPRHSDDGAGS
jgi:hypothetical protein